MLAKEFEFYAPEELDEALGLLGDGGGTEGARRRHEPGADDEPRPRAARRVVSLNHVPGLDYVEEDGDAVAIGAMVRHERLAARSADPRGTFRLLARRRRSSATSRSATAGRSAAASRTPIRRPTTCPSWSLLGATIRLQQPRRASGPCRRASSSSTSC